MPKVSAQVTAVDQGLLRHVSLHWLSKDSFRDNKENRKTELVGTSVGEKEHLSKTWLKKTL